MFSSIEGLEMSTEKSLSMEKLQNKSKIYIYGEQHAVKSILDKEIEIWDSFYKTHNFKHLFLELPYYTAELLNIWMNSETDQILYTVYESWEGSLFHNPLMKDFFIEIKNEYPETIFHGTDIGHQYNTVGKYYLEYLSEHNLKDTEEYFLAKENIEQGEYYYSHVNNSAYREIMMVANFIREFNNLKSENIMGIYGASHTRINSMDTSQSVPSMINQLNKIYINQIYSEDLSELEKDIEPIRKDKITINDIVFDALYFGKRDLKGFKGLEYRAFWLLIDAYEHFKNAKKTGDVLPYNNYPMKVESNQVYIIEYKKTDNTSFRKYYKSDGKIWKNRPSTEEFILNDK